MENPFIGIVIGELIIISIIVIAKVIFNKMEDKKVDKVLQFLDNKTKEDKEAKEKIKECIKIIENNKKEND